MFKWIHVHEEGDESKPNQMGMQSTCKCSLQRISDDKYRGKLDVFFRSILVRADTNHQQKLFLWWPIYLFIYASGSTKIVYTYTNTDKSYIKIKSKDKNNKELHRLYSRVTKRPPNTVFNNLFRHVAMNVKLRRQ